MKILWIKIRTNFLTKLTKNKCKKIWFDDTNIFVETTNNKVGRMPLAWFPGFQNATKTELENYELWSDNSWIHWENLGENLSVEGFFTFKKQLEFI